MSEYKKIPDKIAGPTDVVRFRPNFQKAKIISSKQQKDSKRVVVACGSLLWVVITSVELVVVHWRGCTIGDE